MFEDEDNELVEAKRQLELCKKQDLLYIEIESALVAMRDIAKVVLDNEVTTKELEGYNLKIKNYQLSIKVLEERIRQYSLQIHSPLLQ